MIKKKIISGQNPWVFFWSLLILMLVFNFVGWLFGLSHFLWHLFLHSGVIVFSFLIIIYCLKLSEKSTKYIVSGGVLWILVESVLFLGHIFEEHWLETSLFTFLGMVVGGMLLMFGFKGAVNG